MSRRAPAPPSPWPPWPRCACGGPALPHGVPALRFEFEAPTCNELNASGPSRFPTIARRKKVHAATDEALALAMAATPLPAVGPWCLRLTRLSPQGLDDDAIPGALKKVRDVLAAAIGLDDGSASLGVLYAQEKRRGPLGVRVEVWGGAGAADPALRGGG